MQLRLPILLLFLLVPGCMLLPRAADPAATLAASVTIARDEWGVPHVSAATDAGIAFGVAFAQAEDAYRQIEEDYIHALGRAAYWYGEQFLAADLVRSAFEVERLAREEYEREPPDRRQVWDGYAAGLNHYMRTRGVAPRVITRWEPWMPFALVRTVAAGTVIDGVRLGAELSAAGGLTPVGVIDTAAVAAARPVGEAVAVAPARSATGSALLVQNRYGPLFGAGQLYEVQVQSGTGWHVRGVARLGTPIVQAGHNTTIAWAHTTSGADTGDVYELAFDHPTDPLLYRHGAEWRSAVAWVDTVLVNTPGGVVARTAQFLRTHHGPVVLREGTRALAVRLARLEEGGSLQQWLAMSHARDLEQFRGALAQTAVAAGTLYADAGGNIQYVADGVVPVRAEGLDWTRPVAAAPDSDWRGFRPLAELTQSLNPDAGWISTSPLFAMAAADARDPVTGAAPGGRSADEAARWTVASLVRGAFAARVDGVDAQLSLLAGEWEQVGGQNPARARRLDAALDTLRDWDGHVDTASAATTLYVLWQERLAAGEPRGDLARFHALEAVIAQLERDWGRAFVAWGEINRLQRPTADGAPVFDDDAPSVPAPGIPSRLGGPLTHDAGPGMSRRRYGVSGTAWMSAVELGPELRAHAVVPFGQSADPASRHFTDQTPLFATGELRAAWLHGSDVAAHAQRVYQPAP